MTFFAEGVSNFLLHPWCKMNNEQTLKLPKGLSLHGSMGNSYFFFAVEANGFNMVRFF